MASDGSTARTQAAATPWDYLRDRDITRMGETILDRNERARWAMTFLVGGGLPYMWNELASDIKQICYSLLELQPGGRVLVVGEEVDACGWSKALHDAVGPSGSVDIYEIIEEGNGRIFAGEHGRNGLLGAWQWTYTHDTPDASYDAVLVAQAAQHTDSWVEAGEEFLRVLRPGKRIVSAEALIPGGGGLDSAVNSDVHVRSWFDKFVTSLSVNLAELGAYTAEDIRDAFGDRVEGSGALEWRGIQLFWGRKPREIAITSPFTNVA